MFAECKSCRLRSRILWLHCKLRRKVRFKWFLTTCIFSNYAVFPKNPVAIFCCLPKTAKSILTWKLRWQIILRRRFCKLCSWSECKFPPPYASFINSSQSLKITEKVSFNIASEASYFYILSGQKLTKKAKNGQFLRVFENLKLSVKECYQTGQF